MPGVSHIVRVRWIFLSLLFSCFFILSTQRMNMGIAILSMVNWTAISNRTSNHCHTLEHEELKKDDGEFVWTPSLQAHVLASYFYGLILVQLPSEMLVGRLSPRIVALIGMSLSTVCTFFIPSAARWHVGIVIFVRITKAMGHAAVFSALSVMMGKWIPSKLAVRFTSYATSGVPLGAFCTLVLAGFVCSHPEYGWEFLFYFSGTMGILWCLLWLYLCSEKRFMTLLSNSRYLEKDFPRTDLRVPLMRIVYSKPFLGYMSCAVATYWILSVNLLVIPYYYRNVFELGIEWNALLSSFPNALQAFVYLFSFMLLRRKTTHKTSQRRFVACLGLSTYVTFFVLLSFVKCSRVQGVLMMSIGVGASGFNLAAISLMAVDMSPNFSGILTGMASTLGAVVGCGPPLMVGYLMDGESEIRDWEKIFYASAFIVFISMILFMAYSSCEIQPWNNPLDPQASNRKWPYSKFRKFEDSKKKPKRSNNAGAKKRSKHGEESVIDKSSSSSNNLQNNTADPFYSKKSKRRKPWT